MSPRKKTKKNGRQRILFRYGFIIALMLLLAGFIVWALIDNTVVSAEAWNKAADKELSRVDTIRPERGDILACDGSILATNMQLYTIRVDFNVKKFKTRRFKAALDSLSDSLARYFPRRDKQGWKKYLASQVRNAEGERWSCCPLVARASYSDFQKIQSFPFFNIGRKEYTGLYKEPTLIRTNPYGRMALRSIGRVGEQVDDPTRRGRSGLEMALEKYLCGTPGFTKKVAMTSGISDWVDIPAVRGYDVITTIDIKMQDIVENELNKILDEIQSDWGLCVLMDVKTGDIKAISNLDRTKKGTYIEGMNRAVQQIEPGSVVKVLSMMVALDNGIVSVDEQIDTHSPWIYHGRRLSDTHVSASKTPEQIIIESSNIGMAKIITRAWEKNPGEFYSAIRRTGFLDPLNTGIAGAHPARIDSIAKANGEGQLLLSRMAFGYSTMIPPMQTLALYNAIANDGKFVRPRLVTGMRNALRDTTYEVQYVRDSICSRRTARLLRKWLDGVVNDKHGTAYNMIHRGNVRLAGKTGTCNVHDTTTMSYRPGVSRLAFCGFFPSDEPRYTCIAVVSPPRQNFFGAASTSGRVIRNIAENFYARGMLGNISDFREDARNNTAAKRPAPIHFASADPGRARRVQRDLGVKADSIHHFDSPASPSSGVPNVVGYNIREAIAVLEQAGYNVEFSGAGCVSHQKPAAGASAPRGSRVALNLSR
ncbi:MAG: penicillin-binding transpeptidase domain-containing protein [Clostridium sp.]|nr:penicillin-binding transpeptidase domain-containing protein [Clostridium sp.]